MIFKHLNTSHLAGLNIDVEHYIHEPTGLIHYHLSADNSENAFMIGFATQPMSSRGEAHILEHVVLCGSKKYPVRDPFFSMIKRSLNTFMNAMTASDWTVYPFATQNKKDFFNLLDVYVDAVFFPNIDKLDFAQEGIRVQLDENGKPHYHGIVFNEMKGAMSGEIDQLYYALMPHLFEKTTYHYNSGGDPKHITELTHDDLVAFHKKHYHPSNAIMMSFGDIGAKDIQQRLIDNALCCFDDVQNPAKTSRIRPMSEPHRTTPKVIKDTYTSDKDDDNATHQVIAWLLPNITDPKMRLAFRLMEGVLLEHSGMPLRAYLETTNLGQAPSPLVGLDDSHYDMVFYAGVRGSSDDKTQALLDGVMSVLTEVANKPIDNDDIEMILHQMELDKRHIGGDSMPYGLNLMLEGFGSAIHGVDPMGVWDIDEHLDWLKNQLTDPKFLPNLIKTHLIDNTHRVQLTLSADSQKANRLIQDELASLNALDKTLDDKKRADINAFTKALADRQAMIDDVNVLPKVQISDIPPKLKFVKADIKTLLIDNIPHTLYDYTVGTNGLYYYQLVMGIDDEMILKSPLLAIYLSLISELGTKTLTAREFIGLQAVHSSGVTARISTRTSLDDKMRVKHYFVLATRALNSKPSAIDLVRQVLTDTVFSETDRIKEILTQKALGWQSRLTSSGHAYAMQTASRAMSALAVNEYAFSGLPALNALNAFLADNDYDTLAKGLLALHQKIINLPKLLILVSEEQVKSNLIQSITKSLDNLPVCADTVIDTPKAFGVLNDEFVELHKKADSGTLPSDLAWGISSNVYFNAQSYPAVTADHSDTPALIVLASFMRNGYLHSAIREKGGAYGGGASFDSNTASFRFYSYRDPHFEQTFAHFDKAIDWVLDSHHEPLQLEEAILGIIASMDKPGSPAGDAIKACFNERHDRDEVWQNAMRAKILAVSILDLQRVTKTYLKDKPSVKASLLPVGQKQRAIDFGFEYQSIE